VLLCLSSPLVVSTVSNVISLGLHLITLVVYFLTHAGRFNHKVMSTLLFCGHLFRRLRVSSLAPLLSLVPTTAACRPQWVVSHITYLVASRRRTCCRCTHYRTVAIVIIIAVVHVVAIVVPYKVAVCTVLCFVAYHVQSCIISLSDVR